MVQAKRFNILCYFTLLMVGVHAAVFQSILERISADLGLSLTAEGSLVTMNFIGVVAGPLVAGELGDRIGRKPVAVIAMAAYAAAILVAALAADYGMLAAAILAAGLAHSVVESSMTGLVADANRAGGASALQYSQAWYSAGAVVGPLLALTALSTPLSWRGAFLSLGLLFMALLLVFRRQEAPRSVSPGSVGKPGSATAALLRDEFYLWLCLSIFLYVGIESAAAYWMDTYFVKILCEPVAGKTALTLFWGGTLGGRALGGRFAHRSHAWPVGGLVLSSICFAAVPLSGSAAVCSGLFALAGLGLSTVWPAIMTLASSRYARDRGAAIGLLMSVSGIGGMAIPFGMGILADVRGLAAAMWMLPVLGALTAGLFALTARLDRANGNAVPSG